MKSKPMSGQQFKKGVTTLILLACVSFAFSANNARRAMVKDRNLVDFSGHVQAVEFSKQQNSANDDLGIISYIVVSSKEGELQLNVPFASNNRLELEGKSISGKHFKKDIVELRINGEPAYRASSFKSEAWAWSIICALVALALVAAAGIWTWRRQQSDRGTSHQD